ncbi:hypothetical protein KX928_22900 [Roseobacter sp. YSTF-M11]|uniref:Uncharacterized protein n=1 Tax=Roseobacter insulae TaxID=2859783 RepID=A0A9X1G148_9RHOB|nr:hypothetical protein [Roseobacter insulae]MBW4710648.1 hypothetical protein [Roseobacter insulae]
MHTPRDIDQKAQLLKDALHQHLGVKGRSLDHALRKAGRQLPRRIRTQARFFTRAQTVSGNIKLLRQFDAAQVDAAYAEIAAYLAAIDRSDARKGRLLSILAVVAFNLIVVFTAWVVWLRMRGSI